MDAGSKLTWNQQLKPLVMETVGGFRLVRSFRRAIFDASDDPAADSEPRAIPTISDGGIITNAPDLQPRP